jgi:hypothetical protein
VPSMQMPATLWPNRILHRHSVFCETDQEAVNKAKLYVDGHGVELWEGTRQVALLTRSNCLLNSGGFLQLRARRRRAVCLGNDQRSGRLCPCARSPPAPLCVNGPGALAPGGSPVVALGREA